MGFTRVRLLQRGGLTMNKKYLVLIILAVSYLHLNIFASQIAQQAKDNVLRFHVVANSNTMQDQLIKENVRNAVLLHMQDALKTSSSVAESKQLIHDNMEQITQIAQQVISNWGKDHDVKVVIDTTQFPTKSYGDIVFPAGEYEACRILIGEAVGENWWCVMYPPLCYVDEVTDCVEVEGDLENTLTDEQYEAISFQTEQPYQFRLKLVDLLFR